MLSTIGRIFREMVRRPRHLREASRIPTHLTEAEKLLLFKLSRKSATCAVEVGSYLGASSCYIAAGMLKKKGAKLICVDTWKNDAMTEGTRDTFAEFSSNTAAFGDLIDARRGRSVDLAKSFSGVVDLLFLDADHEYSGVKSDWDSWSPFLKTGAVVAFHDIGWARGVQRVVQEDVLPTALSHGRLPNLFWATVNR
jgi:predicted O-methyltransferase YrrM